MTAAINILSKGFLAFALGMAALLTMPSGCEKHPFPEGKTRPIERAEVLKKADPLLLILSNTDIEIRIEKRTGFVVGLKDLRKNLDLIDAGADRKNYLPYALGTLEEKPLLGYRVQFHGPESDSSPTTPPEISEDQGRYPGGRRVTLEWETPEGWTFEGSIEMPARGAWVEFTARADAPGKMIYNIAFPILYGVRPLAGNGSGDRLALPREGGMEIFNPIGAARDMLKTDQAPFFRMHYPDGHAQTLPMMAYYSPKAAGGFLIYARDPEWTERFFSFHPLDASRENGLTTIMLEARNWDVDGEGGSGMGVMDLSAPIRVECMDSGDWAEAGEIYRSWSETQSWAGDPIALRSEERRRIYEKVSLSVFGLSGRANQGEWMRVFHDLFTGHVPGEGILFVPGWDFHRGGDSFGQTAFAFYQAGWRKDLWLPYLGFFLAMTREARARGDLVYPFFYDLVVFDKFPTWDGWMGDPVSSGDQGAPWISHSRVTPDGEVNVSFNWPGIPGNAHELCPADPKTRDFYTWREMLLATGGNPIREPIIDGLYHDITGSVSARHCFDRLAGYAHGHKGMGWGRFITTAEHDLLASLIDPEKGFGFGQENATEPFFDVVNFSHLGTQGDGPYRQCLKGSPADAPRFVAFDELLMGGKARQIPLVDYVDHAFGPVITGGKVQVSNEIGDAWYWVAAYNYLNGRILELIYFNTPADLFDQIDPGSVTCPEGYPCAFQTGFIGLPDSRGWFYNNLKTADPEKIEFLSNCADLRLRLGNPYLTMGRMLPPPDFDPEPEETDFDYDYYSAIRGPEFYHHGKFRTAPLVASAFAPPDTAESRAALFAANTGTDPVMTNLAFEPGRYDLPERFHAVMKTAGSIDETDLGVFAAGEGGRTLIPLELAPRQLVMIELAGE